MALELERIALNDEFFIERKLYPNVDFYSGLILKTIGIPLSMFTAQFAVARTAGWISHWNEMITDPAAASTLCGIGFASFCASCRTNGAQTPYWVSCATFCKQEVSV